MLRITGAVSLWAVPRPALARRLTAMAELGMERCCLNLVEASRPECLLEVAGLQVAAAAAGAAAAASLGRVWLIAPVAAIAAVELSLRSGIARARHRARQVLPRSLELMAGRLHAGAGRGAAVRAAIALDPEAAAVLRGVLGRVCLGLPLDEALAATSRRSGVVELGVIGQRVRHCDAAGSALAPELAALASGWRAEARSRRLERAGRMAPMAALIDALVIAPACIAALAVGVIAEGVGGLSLLAH